MSRNCSGHDPDKKLCKHGFLQSGACHGMALGTPMCCQEELCGRMFDKNGGKPIQPCAAIPHSRVVR